jgi:hypothetical protein
VLAAIERVRVGEASRRTDGGWRHPFPDSSNWKRELRRRSPGGPICHTNGRRGDKNGHGQSLGAVVRGFSFFFLEQMCVRECVCVLFFFLFQIP